MYSGFVAGGAGRYVQSLDMLSRSHCATVKLSHCHTVTLSRCHSVTVTVAVTVTVIVTVAPDSV